MIRRTHPLLLPALLGAVCLLGAASAPANSPESVRRAILDWNQSHAEAYPRSAQFLAQLAEAEAALRNAGASNAAPAERAFVELQRAVFLSHPLLSAHPILFVVRHQYRPDHHNTATFFPAARQEYNDGRFTPGAALKCLDFAQGTPARTLLDLPGGVLRDPEVHFDGRTLVFAMRTNAADSYHLYTLNADGAGLRPLTTAADVDDIDPLWLPDGGIVFSSTREPKYCMCNRHIMANLFRMEADGANIHQIGKSTLFEGHAALLPDGRILYDRWEYVDRNFGDAQALWTVNPDGTGHAVYWGNNTASPGAVIDARPLPEGDRVLCVFGSCHDRPWGALALIDRQQALDGPAGVVRTWPPDAARLIQQSGWELFDRFTQVRLKYEDPWPLSATTFLCSRMTGRGEQMGIYLVDTFGNEVLLHAEDPACFDPMPLGPRPRPPAIPARRNYQEREGSFYVQDVYRGTHMKGVPRGSIGWLRVVAMPEKRFWTGPAWNGQGQEAPAMNWHDFNNKRILGTVPVASDGSAYFTVPAETFVYFQLLDTNHMMVQSMRSGTLVQPGERAGCIGCHDDRRTAPPVAPVALRQPDRLQGWFGPAREFNYLTEVQPVLDRHCVRCHDFGQDGARKLLLAGDRDMVFNASYNELWRKQYIRVVGAGPADTQAAYSWGAHASRLGQVLLTKYRAQLTDDEFERVVTWIDLNAPYYPSYASAYPNHLAGRSPLTPEETARLEQLTGVPFRQLADHRNNRGPQVSFDRPELSPCLNQFTNAADPNRLEALAVIRAGAARLQQQPEADQPAFVACPTDRWRDEKYTAREAREQAARDAIRSGARVYDGAP